MSHPAQDQRQRCWHLVCTRTSAMRKAAAAIFAATFGAAIACSSSSPSSPAGPSAPQPSNSVPIASLKITGAALVVGDTVQFKASAKMTDQSTQDVTLL